MKAKKGYKKTPLSFNRQAVIASASVTKAKNAIHCFTEIDITEPRRLIKNHFDKTGKNSLLLPMLLHAFHGLFRITHILTPLSKAESLLYLTILP